ncbi:MAG: RNA methyltransferase [Gemmatimonadota bacterium]|nr:RNA methyltransferase [Gemmatimonadota bacterium]
MPSRSERKVWRSLRRRKGRDETGRFLAEGPRLLGELLATGNPVDVVLHETGDTTDSGLVELLAEARERGLRVESVDRRVIEEIADTMTPQPVLAIATMRRWTWDDVAGGPVVLLDGIQDPGNVGTLVRTAAALGAAGTVALEGTADPWGPKAVRASAGAGLRRPVFRADAVSTLDELRRRRLQLWVAAADGEPVARGDRAETRVALALGSETGGVSGTVAGGAVRRVAVEMSAGVESLNVAAAGAILLDRILGGGGGSVEAEGATEGRGT